MLNDIQIENPDRLPRQYQCCLSLAAMAQALSVIDTIAYGRTVHEEHQSILINSLFDTEPASFACVLPELEHLTPGINTLKRILISRTNHSDVRVLHYMINVIQLKQAYLKQWDLQQQIRKTLESLEAKYPSKLDRTQPNAISELAALFQSQVGKLWPRIEIKGRDDVLQQPQTKALIQTLLFAALRLCLLWHQLGGRRWQLLLRRQQQLDMLEKLYDTLSHR